MKNTKVKKAYHKISYYLGARGSPAFIYYRCW